MQCYVLKFFDALNWLGVLDSIDVFGSFDASGALDRLICLID